MFYVRLIVFTWLVCFTIFSINAFQIESLSALTTIFVVLSACAQASLLCIPLLFLYVLAKHRPYSKLLSFSAIFIASLLLILIIANYKLYELYGFFINSFVLNILLTPGGIEALGLSSSTIQTLVFQILVSIAVVYIVARYIPFERIAPQITINRALILWLIIFTTQSAIYSYSQYRYKLEILQAASKIAWYIPVTTKTFFKWLGIERTPRQDAKSLGLSKRKHGPLNYLESVQLKPFDKSYNIVWLVVESWRSDMVDPTIMATTYQFAKNNLWFRQHYSGGNGTRVGMFTQFYGLYGSHWFDVLEHGIPPIIIRALRNQHYSMHAFTSAKFSYPEFDKTIFKELNNSELHEDSNGVGWQRDQRNVTRLIETFNASPQPFFSFMFFESPHANYHFPDDIILEKNYLKEFDYLTADYKKDIQKIKNRYINACYYLDQQLKRVFDALVEKKLLNSTIVILTGDHGEEFMENGRWGHNSSFAQQQIRVPLVLHVPGQKAFTTDKMTSHLDIPATLLHGVGAISDNMSIGFGYSLLSNHFNRTWTVVSDWNGDNLITQKTKYMLSRTNSQLFDMSDKPIQQNELSEADKIAFQTFVKGINRFYN